MPGRKQGQFHPDFSLEDERCCYNSTPEVTKGNGGICLLQGWP